MPIVMENLPVAQEPPIGSEIGVPFSLLYVE